MDFKSCHRLAVHSLAAFDEVRLFKISQCYDFPAGSRCSKSTLKTPERGQNIV